MADEKVPAKDLQVAFKRLKSSSAENKTCFDCHASNPTWASVTYGVFLCIDCSAIHRSLGVHLTFVRSIQLDTNWTWLQLRSMQVGGNAKANAFFRQHNLTTSDSSAKYKSRVAAMYREKVASLAHKACAQYGKNIIHIDTHHHAVSSPEEKEVDFFSQSHTANDLAPTQSVPSPRSTPVNNENSDPDADKLADPTALSISPPKSSTKEARVPTIGGRKPKSAAGKKKGGMGAKKSGLGATKVSSNFAEIESEAQKFEKMKEATNVETLPGPSASLQYKSQNMLKEEEKLKNIDPRKAEQMQRLGMGMAGVRGGIGHSASESMNTVEQVAADSYQPTYKDRYNYQSSSSSNFFDSYYMDDPVTTYSDEPPAYESSFATKSFKDGKDYSSFNRSFEDSRSRSNRREVPQASSNDEIQKKFGGAKAISSKDVFGDQGQDFETQERLDRYHGSSAISSADLFGDSKKEKSGSMRSVDYSQIKAGVSQVTGKLSNMASGVIGSLQSRYSGSN